MSQEIDIFIFDLIDLKRISFWEAMCNFSQAKNNYVIVIF